MQQLLATHVRRSNLSFIATIGACTHDQNKNKAMAHN